jgi:DNA-binding NarL/FixJ family response regulator
MMDSSLSAGPVLVLDDHPLISAALILALQAEGIDAVPLLIAGFDEILVAASRYRPGLVLLELDLGDRLGKPPPKGFRLIGPLRSRGCAVLIVTASRSRGAMAAAVARGEIGWVGKAEPSPGCCRSSSTPSKVVRCCPRRCVQGFSGCTANCRLS